MSRLLPERISVGLFSGASWLRRSAWLPGKWLTSDESSVDCLEALDLLVGQDIGKAKRKITTDLLISDSSVRLIALPWQESLTSNKDLRGYAEACFARAGVPLDAAWVCQTGFRHYGGGGIAFAVPREWFQQIMDRAAMHQLRVRSILPVSAAAYWYRRTAWREGRSLTLLRDADSVSAITYQGDRMLGIEMQPAMGSIAAATSQLLGRIAGTHADVRTVRFWAASDAPPDAGEIERVLPEAVVIPLLRHYWE